mgnify:CR=1 FL=1
MFYCSPHIIINIVKKFGEAFAHTSQSNIFYRLFSLNTFRYMRWGGILIILFYSFLGYIILEMPGYILHKKEILLLSFQLSEET